MTVSGSLRASQVQREAGIWDAEKLKKSKAWIKRYSGHGYIGVDLDGTLAHYDDEWRGIEHIGDPIPLMVARVKVWLAQGIEVRIVTARVAPSTNSRQALAAIEDWLRLHVGRNLIIQCEKTFQLIELWDDRAVQVVTNQGRRADGQ